MSNWRSNPYDRVVTLDQLFDMYPYPILIAETTLIPGDEINYTHSTLWDVNGTYYITREKITK